MDNDKVAEMYEKLKQQQELQEKVRQQQCKLEAELESTLGKLQATEEELKSKEELIKELLENPENAHPIPEEFRHQLEQKDVIIAQLQIKIREQGDEIKNLLKDKQNLQEKVVSLEIANKDKSLLITIFQEKIDTLQAQINLQNESIENNRKIQEENSQNMQNIFFSGVFNSLKKNARAGCVANLSELVNRGDAQLDQMVIDFKGLFKSGQHHKAAAEAYLLQYPWMYPFNNNDEGQLIHQIQARVPKASLEQIECLLNCVGNKRNTQFGEDFYSAARNNKDDTGVEQFLEGYPTYYTPLTERAKNILCVVRKKVTEKDYNKLYRDVTSNQPGRNENRVLFHRLATQNWSDHATAREFIKKSRTDFNGFMAWFW